MLGGKGDRGGSLARRRLLAAAGLALAGLALALPYPTGALAQAGGRKPSGTVSIEQVQISFIGSGNLGGGELRFQGKTYPFTIGGLGIGGIGASKITATGAVYGLERIEQFPGAYGQVRAGAVAGTESTGSLWLENGNGVEMHLDARREGVHLALGADAIYIQMK